MGKERVQEQEGAHEIPVSVTLSTCHHVVDVALDKEEKGSNRYDKTARDTLC